MANEKMEFKFYHADRMGHLSEGQAVNLCERGLSPFGRTYCDEIYRHKSTGAELNPTAYREFMVEEIRAANYDHFAVSRFQCFFGANYIEEAIRFAKSILPIPEKPIPIFEVFASTFVTLDMNLIDTPQDDPEFVENIHRYWKRVISNSGPPSGNRRPPTLEVLMRLPVRIGKVVEIVEPASPSI